MNIPTADEFLRQKPFINGMKRGDQQVAMIEFTKLHVQAALESAYKNSIMYKDLGEGEDGKICYEMGDIFYDEYDYPIAISKNSILNAYPLENIK
jgi:hypothetical protein